MNAERLTAGASGKPAARAEQLSFLEAPALPADGALRKAAKPADTFADVRPEDLPESLRRLCALLGLPKVLHLARTYGGTRVTIPKYAPDDSPLVRVLGRAPARLLGAHYGGCELYIPSLARFRRETRDRRIRRDYDAGCTMQALALREGLSLRRIASILNTAEEP